MPSRGYVCRHLLAICVKIRDVCLETQSNEHDGRAFIDFLLFVYFPQMFTNTSNAFLLLPTELLAQIFALTTTLDSGATLRSLLLVSRLFHSISVPLKFYCVNLTTSRDIQRFHRELERLEHASTHSRRIFHLFVSLAQSD